MTIPANTIPCLTVRQPWAWAMFSLGDESKDVENRSQRINYRGPMAIHVAQHWRLNAVTPNLYKVLCLGIGSMPKELTSGELRAQLGMVIGIVDVVDCVRDSPSRWAIPGQWHWVLRNNRRVRPVPVKGQQGRFVCPVELEVL